MIRKPKAQISKRKPKFPIPAVGNFIIIPARIGSWELVAVVDTASTTNLMPLLVAQHLRLPIDRTLSEDLDMAKGSVSTIGQVTFRLTIESITKTIDALVLKDFAYTLLLGTETCSSYRLVIDTE